MSILKILIQISSPNFIIHALSPIFRTQPKTLSSTHARPPERPSERFAAGLLLHPHLTNATNLNPPKHTKLPNQVPPRPARHGTPAIPSQNPPVPPAGNLLTTITSAADPSSIPPQLRAPADASRDPEPPRCFLGSRAELPGQAQFIGGAVK